MIDKLLAFFTAGHTRSIQLRKNVLISMIFKGAGILISFLAVPLYLDFLSDEKYGIWLTINSVVAWFNLFDLGLGNGFRNRFAESLARDEKDEARSYLSTTYALVASLSMGLLLVFVLVNPFVNWADIFNGPESMSTEISKTVILVFSFFCLQFIFQLIKTLVLADQRPSWVEVINFSINFLSFIGILILGTYFSDSLFDLALVVSGSNLFVLLLFSMIFYTGKYKAYRPTWSMVDRAKMSDLFGLGGRFFILQGAALVVFMTDNLIISHIADPEQVPPYNIAYRYFSVLLMLFNIVSTAYWSPFTEAFQKNDLKWIRSSVKKFQKMWVGVAILAVLMIVGSGLFYDFWIGDRLVIPFALTLLFGTWAILNTSVGIYGNFLSGIGKIELSVWNSLLMMVINIPLSIYFGRELGMGSAGVITATIVCMIPRLIFQPIQYLKIVTGTARGVWNR